MFGKQGSSAKPIAGATVINGKKSSGKLVGGGNVKKGVTVKGIAGNKNKLK